MNKTLIFLCYSLLLLTLFDSCGTSTGSRYPQEQKLPQAKPTGTKENPENFDLTNYRAKIDVKGIEKKTDSTASKVWYSYNTAPAPSDTAQTIIKTMPGYRVLVLSTDNIDDANTMKSDIYFKTNHSAVYVIFDPPFYKVEAGDFTDRNDAQSMSFKLKQMGYNDVRVISETINKYK